MSVIGFVNTAMRELSIKSVESLILLQCAVYEARKFVHFP